MDTQPDLDQLLAKEQAIVIRMLVLTEETEAITIQLDDHPPYPRFSPEYDDWHKAAVYARQSKINDHRRLKLHLHQVRVLIQKEQHRLKREAKTRIQPLMDDARESPHVLITAAAHLLERLVMEGVDLTEDENDVLLALKAFQHQAQTQHAQKHNQKVNVLRR